MQYMRQQWSVPRTAGVLARLLYALAIAILPGCQPSGAVTHLHQYVAALAGSARVEAPASTWHALPPPPSTGALQLVLTSSSLDGLDFLALSGCAVQATLIKRNTSLGRAAKASQRLLLALEYLRLAPACIQQLQARDEEALAISLQNAWQEHRALLPALIFNATLGSEEYRNFWLADLAPSDYPRSDPEVAQVALRFIVNDVRRWLSGDYRAQNLDFELRLGAVAGGDGGARLQAPLRQDDARSLLHSLASIIALEQQLAAVLPPGYRDWQQRRNQRLAKMSKQGAIGAHDSTPYAVALRVENWLHCNTRCNMAPRR
jgi:hypothetical protein